MLSKVKLLTPLKTSSKPAERRMSVGEEEAKQADWQTTGSRDLPLSPAARTGEASTDPFHQATKSLKLQSLKFKSLKTKQNKRPQLCSKKSIQSDGMIPALWPEAKTRTKWLHSVVTALPSALPALPLVSGKIKADADIARQNGKLSSKVVLFLLCFVFPKENHHLSHQRSSVLSSALCYRDALITLCGAM